MRILNVALIYILSLLLTSFIGFYGATLLELVKPSFQSYLGCVLIFWCYRMLQVKHTSVILPIQPENTEEKENGN